MDIRQTAQLVLLAKVIKMDHVYKRGIGATVMAEFSMIVAVFLPGDMREAIKRAMDYAQYAYGEDERPSWLTDEVLEESGVSEW